MSKSAKIAQMIEIALEVEEDALWIKLAEERDTANAIMISHEDAWR